MLVALSVAFVLSVGIALTLVRKNGLGMLRFVTLIPVVLMVGAVLKLGARRWIDAALGSSAGARDRCGRNASRFPWRSTTFAENWNMALLFIAIT